MYPRPELQNLAFAVGQGIDTKRTMPIEVQVTAACLAEILSRYKSRLDPPRLISFLHR